LDQFTRIVKEALERAPSRPEVLGAVSTLNLPDWAIGAGFVRNTVWDVLHGYALFTRLHDVDVVYFDRSDISLESEITVEKELSSLLPNVPWSVRNQARMHIRNGDAPYRDTADAISMWLETPTAVAVTLDDRQMPHLIAPWGLADLCSLVVKPTPSGQQKYGIYLERLRQKNWRATWPRLSGDGLPSI
jgi:hypothetical protein